MQPYIDYFSKNMDTYVQLVWQHLFICGLAIIGAVMLGIPCGLLVTRSKALYRIITTFFNTLRIIPSLAVLVFLIPIMGIGTKPALMALIVLAVPPILVNTALGIQSVPVFMEEAAAGMGMDERQIFLKVKIPLAIPYMMTGIKTAAAEVVASATLAAYIGSGGLGVIIYNGISMMKTEYLLIGGVSVALLTIGINLLLSFFERKLVKYKL